MKALTLTQPWASAVALEIKRFETRSWATKYRGPLAIHASKGFPQWAKDFARTERTLGRLPARLPLSAVVCVVELMTCEPTEEVAIDIGAVERLYGDYAPGRWAWGFDLVEVLAEPIPARGALGLWEWTR